MNSRQIIGIAVVSITDGEKVGTVDRLYFDPSQRQVEAFTVRSGGGLFSGKETCLVATSDMRSLGPDALTIADKSVLHDDVEPELPDSAVELDSLLKRKVVTEGGTYVGQVASVEFGQDDFKLSAVEVSPGFFKSNEFIPNNLVTSIGPDLLVVDDAVCATDETQEESAAE